jgi:hypothetical protein
MGHEIPPERETFLHRLVETLPEPKLMRSILDILRVDAEGPISLSPEDLRQLRGLCRGRLGPLLASRFSLESRLESAGPAWANNLRTNTARNLALVRDLAQIAQQARDVGVRMLVLKGPPLALELYDQIGARLILDLDILVRSEDLESMDGVLRNLGYRPSRTYDLSAELAMSHHLPPYVHPAERTTVEVHWAVGGRLARLRPEKLEGIWGRARTLDLMGLEKIEVPGREDLLSFLCIHATGQHLLEMGLPPLYDIASFVSRHRKDLDWDEVTVRAAEWESLRSLLVALGLASRLLGAPVPEGLLRQLDDADPGGEVFTLAARVACQVSVQTGKRRRATLPLQRLVTGGSFSDLWHLLRDSVIRSPAIDHRQYGPEFSVASRPRQLLIRLSDLFRRYLPVIWGHRSREERELAAARVRVADWLMAPPAPDAGRGGGRRASGLDA